MAAHLFAEEINTESDLVGENSATKGDELYFQDLPIYNKLNISSAKVGEKPPPTKTRKRNTLGILIVSKLHMLKLSLICFSIDAESCSSLPKSSK